MASPAEGLLGPPFALAAPTPTTTGLLGPPAAKTGAKENCFPTFLSSGDPCVDFFFQIAPGAKAKKVNALLDAAWAHDPLTALKLLCHLRAVCRTGRSGRNGFYAAALWLHRHHPKTLALNAEPLTKFGYLKDLPEILHRLVAPGTRKRMPSMEEKPKKEKSREGQVERIAAEMAKVKIMAEEAATKRHEKEDMMAATALKRYADDPAYRLLHDKTSDLFAALLSSDLQLLKSGDMEHLSLAAKWCPSLNSSYDRTTLLCESIARRLFPRNSDPDYLTIQEPHYVYRIRDRLRKEVIVPLRRALQLPEFYMSAKKWGSLPYNRVASVAMKNYNEIFLSRDEERFSQYLGQVKKGKAKIADGVLLPHEILAPIMSGQEDEVAELQWRRMVSDISELGKLSNCIAVCDVSGSMTGTPMDVCVALGMLISEMSEEPWKGRVITFSTNPQLHYIEGKTLREKAEFVKRMDSGGNIDFQKVFDQILRVAVEGKLEAEKMIKKVFVFSHMEFDEASGKTDYEVICSKFEESDYGSAVPEIVFWNLRDSRPKPVTSDQRGVALVSGFSKNLMKPFLKGEDIPSPKAVMEAAIAGEEYKKLAVYD